jgi:hypothetical protein
VLLDADGEIAQHVLVDAHVALELVHGRRRRIEIEQHVVALAVLLDAVGDVAQAPIFALRDLPAMLGDERGELVGDCLDLRGGDVLPRDEHVLVERHRFSLWLFAAPALRGPSASRPGLAGRAGKEAADYSA